MAAPLAQLAVELVDVLGAQPSDREDAKSRPQVPVDEPCRLQCRLGREVRRRVLEPAVEEFSYRPRRGGDLVAVGCGHHGGKGTLGLAFAALYGLGGPALLTRQRVSPQVDTQLPGVSSPAHRTLHSRPPCPISVDVHLRPSVFDLFPWRAGTTALTWLRSESRANPQQSGDEVAPLGPRGGVIGTQGCGGVLPWQCFVR